MFDPFDFFGPTGTEGTRKMRIFAGLLGALIGGGMGIAYGQLVQGSTSSAITSGVVGAVFGGVLAALFAVLVIALCIGAVVLAGTILWHWYSKGG